MTSSMLASIPNFHSPNPQHPSLDIVVGWNSKRAYYIYQRDFALPPTHDPKKRCSYTITYLPSNTHTKHPNEVPSPHWIPNRVPFETQATSFTILWKQRSSPQTPIIISIHHLHLLKKSIIEKFNVLNGQPSPP